MISVTMNRFLTDCRVEKGLVYGLMHCSPDWSWEPRTFSNYDLWYVLSGQGSIVVNGQKYPTGKGSCFLLQPGDRAEAVQSLEDRLTVIYIHFHVRCPEDGNSAHIEPALPSRTLIRDPYSFDPMLYRLLELCDCGLNWKDEEFELLLKQTLLHLLRHHDDPIHEASGTALPQHTRLIQKLMLHIRRGEGHSFTAEEITQVTGLSPRYADRLFRKHTGLSIKQYGIRVKMERALYLLSETKMNVSQVAQALGYADLFYFSRQFKRYFGMPPTSYPLNSERRSIRS